MKPGVTLRLWVVMVLAQFLVENPVGFVVAATIAAVLAPVFAQIECRLLSRLGRSRSAVKRVELLPWDFA